jgi:hypothetical protein
MNLNEPFFNDSRQERIGENIQTLVHLGSEAGCPFIWVFQGATEDADANGDGLKRVGSVCTEEYANSRKWGGTQTR